MKNEKRGKPVSRRGFLKTSGVVGGAVAGHKLAGTPSRAASAASGQTAGAERAVTRELAHFVTTSRPADIPEAARQEARRSLLNWVGCAVGGSRHVTVDRALAALAEFSGPATATLLGRRERLDILHAALMNGISSHVLDFDDTHLKTIIHPAGPVAAAILALSEKQPVPGTEFLHAFILGVEVECRIGNAVYPSHYDAGWHITGTAGVFGAAAAAGKLLGLSDQQMTWALGIAATQSAGLKEMFGTMCKSLHPGRAAQNGLAAALLAGKNFTSSERGIEAPGGFAFVLASRRNLAAVTDGFGQSWEISLNTYKPFPCGIVIHPSIDGCLQLRKEYDVRADDVADIALRVHPLTLQLTGKKTPGNGLESKFSVFHAAAVSVIRGRAGEQEFSDEAARDPRVITLRDRVSATPEAGLREDEAHVTITLRDGRKLTRHVEHAVGSVDRPMSDSDLEGKFRGLADGVLPGAQVDRLIQQCWSVESLANAGDLARAAAKEQK